MTTLDQGIAIANTLAKVYAERPSRLYRPGRTHDLDGNPVPPERNMQLQFHKAPHVIRAMTPGNGSGKTGSLAVEVDWAMSGDHPWQRDFMQPAKPRTAIWLALKFSQWETMRPRVEKWWPRSVVESYNINEHRYVWPDGSRLFIYTAESDWSNLQGIEIELVVGDENFPVAMWRELIKRRRGTTRTRYCIGATQTEGIGWMYTELYLPWRKFHEDRGILDEREMVVVQGHHWSEPGLENLPGLWVWPYGDHRDNPTATAETWAFYLATTGGSPAERMTRLYGGFRTFSSQPVFDPEAIEKMRGHILAGQKGCIVEDES